LWGDACATPLESAQARGEATIDFEERMIDGPVFEAALYVLAAAKHER
jgi:citrate lyase beta subunit